jgi:hypothetical protein
MIDAMPAILPDACDRFYGKDPTRLAAALVAASFYARRSTSPSRP